jgi:Lipocalin-like domain
MQSLVGVWKLVEVHAFGESGRDVASPVGPQPLGVAIINAERVMAMAGDGRATEVANRAFAAYSGNYTFDGTKAVTRVDGASSPAMLEDRVRHIRFDSPARMTMIPASACLVAVMVLNWYGNV